MSSTVSPGSASALMVTMIDLPAGGALGLTHCPGRCGGSYGIRNLDADLAAIESWGADLVLTLNEAHEFERLGVPALPSKAAARKFIWRHVPIPDFGAPTTETWQAWNKARPDILQVIDQRGRIVLHCAAGLGRTGTIAAKMLSELGLSPQAAIELVRARRPGTIETSAQMDFVMHGQKLL